MSRRLKMLRLREDREGDRGLSCHPEAAPSF